MVTFVSLNGLFGIHRDIDYFSCATDYSNGGAEINIAQVSRTSSNQIRSVLSPTFSSKTNMRGSCAIFVDLGSFLACDRFNRDVINRG